MGNTNIEWTDKTWNPWQGCHKISLGCKHCYMFREKKMYGQEPNVVVRSKPHTFNLPLRLKEPQRVFSCSWSDWFIEEADPWRPEAWAIIDQTRHLTYQIVTKRIERVTDHLPWGPQERPWPHVWIIVSVEDQPTADVRVPQLLRVNAAVRGLSVEPLLGPVDLKRYLTAQCEECHETIASGFIDLNTKHPWGHPCPPLKTVCESSLKRGLHWVIGGGESGPSHRSMQIEWVSSIAEQCRAAGIPLFVKQDSGPRPGRQGRIPDDLWAFKEFPGGHTRRT